MGNDQFGIETNLSRSCQGKRECWLVIAVEIHFYKAGTGTVMIILEELPVVLAQIGFGDDLGTRVFRGDSSLQGSRKSAHVRGRLS